MSELAQAGEASESAVLAVSAIDEFDSKTGMDAATFADWTPGLGVSSFCEFAMTLTVATAGGAAGTSGVADVEVLF